jgi:predicted phage terminase large subunit-like protein
MHKRLKVGWWQKDACDHLMQWYFEYKQGLRPKLLIQAPPQFGKSTIVSDFMLWIIGKDSETDTQDIKIIYASFSDRLSVRANKYIQRFANTQRYQDVFPKYNQVSANQEAVHFGQDGYFRNTTCGGAVTGESLNIGCLDDVLKGREEANSATIRDKKWEWLTNDFFTRFSDDGALIGIMTRWHVDDPFGRLIEADLNVKVVTYKAIATTDEPHRKQGESLFPEHKSIEFLNGVKKIMSAANWEALYQQNPTIAEGNFFKPDFINIIDVLPNVPRLQYVRAWDLAATANGGDYTVGVKLAYDSSTHIAYVVDIVRGQYSPEDVEKIILTTAQNDGRAVKIRLPQDPGQAGKSQARNFVRLLQGFTVIAEPVTGDKEVRAGGVAAQANIGNLCMLRSAWNRAFTDELRLFPNGVNDDQVDALSDSYNHFVITKTPITISTEALNRAKR